MKLFSIRSLRRFVKKCLPMMALSVVIPKIAEASNGYGGNFKAVEQLSNLQEVISGPILFSIAVIMAIVTFLMLPFIEWGDGFRKLIQVVFWTSCAAGAASLIAMIAG